MVDEIVDLDQAQELVTNFKDLTPALQEWVLKMVTVGMNSNQSIF
jgi:hypothetical protein